MTDHNKRNIQTIITVFVASGLMTISFIIGNNIGRDRANKKISEAEIKVEVVEQDLITAIETILNLEGWSLEYKSWNDDSYQMKIDIGDEVVYFYDRKSLADFFKDLNRIEAFQK